MAEAMTIRLTATSPLGGTGLMPLQRGGFTATAGGRYQTATIPSGSRVGAFGTILRRDANGSWAKESSGGTTPLHRVVDGTEYPATLIATADHDDRVVPLHSYKFGASLQAAQAGDAPILLRIAGSAGHGAGTSLSMAASEWADLLAFAAAHTGLVVPPAAEEPS